MSDLPSDLADLYASERAAAGPSAADRTRVIGAVLASVGVAGAVGGATTAGATTTAAGGIGGKLVVALLVLGAAGGTAALVSRRAAAEPVAVPAFVARTAPGGDVQIHAGVRAVVAEVAPTPAAPARAAVVASVAVAAPAPALVAEAVPAVAAVPAESDARRLARAWTLVEHGDATGAIVLAESVPTTSALAEERAAVRAIALARLGRSDDACTAAAAFAAAFPTSVHRALVAKEAPCGSSL